MKVLIISPGYLPITGDHGGAIENLINIFLKDNDLLYKNEITVYSANGDYKETDINFGYTKFRIIEKKSFNYRLNQKLTNLKRRFNKKLENNNYYNEIIKDIRKRKEENYFDVIIFQNGQDHIINFKKNIKTNSKLILHLHNDYLNIETRNAKEILNSFHEVWTVSKFVKNSVLQIDNNFKNVKVLYNTIDFSKFKNSNKNEISTLKKKLNIRDNDFVFIYVGRVTAVKGTLELAIAFDRLTKKYNNLKLLIVGGTKSLDDSDEYYMNVKKISKSNENIIMTGQVNNLYLASYYYLSNVQIIPSKWNEAFGLIALEGIACDLPIISSDRGGLKEVLENDCLYLDMDNLIDSLYSNMEFVINKYDKVSEFKKSYSKKICKFSKENYCETMNKYINNK